MPSQYIVVASIAKEVRHLSAIEKERVKDVRIDWGFENPSKVHTDDHHLRGGDKIRVIVNNVVGCF